MLATDVDRKNRRVKQTFIYSVYDSFTMQDILQYMSLNSWWEILRAKTNFYFTFTSVEKFVTVFLYGDFFSWKFIHLSKIFSGGKLINSSTSCWFKNMQIYSEDVHEIPKKEQSYVWLVENLKGSVKMKYKFETQWNKKRPWFITHSIKEIRDLLSWKFTFLKMFHKPSIVKWTDILMKYYSLISYLTIINKLHQLRCFLQVEVRQQLYLK